MLSLRKCPHRMTVAAGHLFRHSPFSTTAKRKQPQPPTSKDGTRCSKKTLPVCWKAAGFGGRIAVKDEYGAYTYEELLATSVKLANEYEQQLGGKRGERVAYLCPNDGSYILAQWAAFINGQIAVPLSPLHPDSMLEYFIDDCMAGLLVTTPAFADKLEPIADKRGLKVVVVDVIQYYRENGNGEGGDEVLRTPSSDNGNNEKDGRREGYSLEFQLPDGFYNSSDALIIYTSGSTGKPKGAVVSHRSLQAQIDNMVEAWKWSPNDTILHCLPLHHTHGIVNALLCPLAVGARCVMMPSFNAEDVWKRVLGLDETVEDRVNMFTGVPTMYVKLIEEYKRSLSKNQRMVDYVRAVCSQKIRVFMSGSAPLPGQVFDTWESITGHKILERYGMTETGMVLTNPIDASERVPGKVGNPFQSVEVRLVEKNKDGPCTVLLAVAGSSSTEVDKEKSAVKGELQVKGESLFRGYYGRPDQTAESFTSDGWFRTGDWVEYSGGSFSILGRMSVDVIKTGGYKVSALHVESTLRENPLIEDATVVGVNDLTWGQKVVAVIVLKTGSVVDVAALKEWTKTKLPSYEAPSVYRIVDSIPRNLLGKVNKRELVKQLFSEDGMMTR